VEYTKRYLGILMIAYVIIIPVLLIWN